MIEIRSTVESVAQAQALLEAGVDAIQFGEAEFGLRLPHSFSRAEQQELVDLAHSFGKKAIIVVNGIMHPEKMKKIPEYLAFLVTTGVDQLVVGDPGIIYLIRKNNYQLPFIYDGETLVTSSRQINFWSKKGAVGAVLAREVPFDELVAMKDNLAVPAEILVYGATCIHQSKRPLLQNYYNFKGLDEATVRERDLFLSEPKKADTHYSIFEDSHGTHIFADNDVNLLQELPQLFENHYTTWKLDGIYAPGENFVEVAKVFVAAKAALETGAWSESLVDAWNEQIQHLHPAQRELDSGFFHIQGADIK